MPEFTPEQVQDAGRRGGLEDARGNLAIDFEDVDDRGRR